MLDPVELSRLKWRSRRGMLENDLVLQAFYARHEAGLDAGALASLNRLLDLPDNDLWDLISGRQGLFPKAAAGDADMLDRLRACDARQPA